MSNSHKIIKWNQVSELLSGNDNSIRQNKVPKKYKNKVDELLELVSVWEKDIVVKS